MSSRDQNPLLTYHANFMRTLVSRSHSNHKCHLHNHIFCFLTFSAGLPCTPRSYHIPQGAKLLAPLTRRSSQKAWSKDRKPIRPYRMIASPLRRKWSRRGLVVVCHPPSHQMSGCGVESQSPSCSPLFLQTVALYCHLQLLCSSLD